jgi:hypothetical protein
MHKTKYSVELLKLQSGHYPHVGRKFGRRTNLLS